MVVKDRFRGKTWIYWTQLLVFGAFGLFGLILGPLFWAGLMTDARGEVRPQAGPPLTIVGVFMMAVAILAAFNIIARRRPMIRCFREGIECMAIGRTSLDDSPMMPGLVRLVWSIVSGQGFRLERIRTGWAEFRGAEVAGLPMAYELLLFGFFTRVESGEVRDGLRFAQVSLRDDPKLVAEALNRLAKEEGMRDTLESWSGRA